MSAANGTPTVFEKIAVAVGAGAAIGLSPAEITAVQTGEKADISKAEQVLLNLAKPILDTAEADGLADLTTFASAVLAAVPTVTSVAQATNIVVAAAKAEAGTLASQVESLGQTSIVAVISAVLTSIGKVNVPAA